MIDLWLNLKQKAASLLEREPSKVRLIAWRNRVTKVVFFLDNHFPKMVSASILLVIIFGSLYFSFWRAPRPFPEQALVTIERGDSLSVIADHFEEKSVIRSKFWLKVFIFAWGGEKNVIAGDYYFPRALSVFKVAKMIRKGQFGLIALRITVPEGVSSVEMAKILEEKLPNFNSDDFLKEVTDNNYEGYLFPDTYFFTPNTKASEVILTMRENFARQVSRYEGDIALFKKPLDEVIRMASIIEDEANGSLESKRIVSGILWKRMRLEMPLQVDAPFQYYNGRNSYTLTKEDLSEDHEYNTYVNKGLPPTAITNPGIDSIRAAITPTQTEYLYFLSDRQGGMHYAKTFEDHKINRELYLN